MAESADNEVVREALINLERSREKERVLREQANNLLEGLEIITSATGTEDMLGRLLKMVTEQLGCEDAFILSPKRQLEEQCELECIGSTDPIYAAQSWHCQKVFQRVLDGHPAMLFSVVKMAEWMEQSEAVQARTGSVLLIAFPGVEQSIMLCCVSSQRAYFNKIHLGLMQRLVPIASHALHTLNINEQLRREIDERNRLEKYASFQAGIAEMSASVLHNIGNTITGAQGQLLKMEDQRTSLHGLVRVFGTLQQWVSEGVPDADQLEKMGKVLDGACQMLEEITGESGNLHDGLNALERSTHHVAEIIQMQRGVSRPVLTASEFGIEQMVEDTLVMIHEMVEKREIVIETHIAPPLETVCLPRNPMIQMLLNLVKNSMESIDERRLVAPGEGKVEVYFEAIGPRLQMRVVDNGVGIAAERMEAIFKFGESSKERGSGFGLHSVANFVKGIEGSIKVESEGHLLGATMVVELPLTMGKDLSSD